MLRIASIFAIAVFASLGSAGAANAEDEKWTVADVSGAASVATPAVATHKVTRGETLAPGATLTTGADGEIKFTDGKTVVTVRANSRLTMPADPSDMMTRFMQDMGSVFFKVEKRPMAHFEVQTPLVAAIVKGTQFTVTAAQAEHSVEVSEGLVEVVAMTGGQKELVPAGRSAHVRTAAPAKLKLAGDPIKFASAQGSITRAIGVDPIDYSAVTSGLVAASPVTGLTTAKTEGGSSATVEGSGAAAGDTRVAVDVSTGPAGGVVANVDVGLSNAGGGGGVAVGVDAGVGVGGSGGVGVGVDVGAGAGGGGGTGVSVGAGVDLGGTTTTVGVSAGAGSGGGVGVGIGVGGTPPGQGGTSNGGGVGVGIGVGGTPPGQGGTSNGGGIGVGIGVGGTPPGQGGTSNGGGIGISIGIGGTPGQGGGIGIGIGVGGTPPGQGGTPPGHGGGNPHG